MAPDGVLSLPPQNEEFIGSLDHTLCKQHCHFGDFYFIFFFLKEYKSVYFHSTVNYYFILLTISL